MLAGNQHPHCNSDPSRHTGPRRGVRGISNDPGDIDARQRQWGGVHSSYKKKRERLSTLPLSCSGDNPDQVQTITPVELSQVLAESEWVAVALQACGGPATRTATTVTFCEGVKPCIGVAIVAVPAKYAPLLSA